MENKEELAGKLIGMDMEEAISLLTESETSFRILSVDGEKFMVTQDFQPDRFNLIIMSGKVDDILFG